MLIRSHSELYLYYFYNQALKYYTMKIIITLILLSLAPITFSQKKKIKVLISPDSLAQQEQALGFGSSAEWEVLEDDGFIIYVDKAPGMGYVMLRTTRKKVKLENLEFSYMTCELDEVSCSEVQTKYFSKVKVKNGKPKVLFIIYPPDRSVENYVYIDVEDYFLSKLK